MLLSKMLKYLEDRFALFALELKFRQMESKEARAMRLFMSNIEEMGKEKDK